MGTLETIDASTRGSIVIIRRHQGRCWRTWFSNYGGSLLRPNKSGRSRAHNIVQRGLGCERVGAVEHARAGGGARLRDRCGERYGRAARLCRVGGALLAAEAVPLPMDDHLLLPCLCYDTEWTTDSYKKPIVHSAWLHAYQLVKIHFRTSPGADQQKML